ncbi:MAG: MmgE/PrpD family protein [Haloarculaceae archaeon]
MEGAAIPWQFGTGTRRVASFVDDLELESLSDAVRDDIRRTVLDTLGAVTAGHTIRETAAVAEYVAGTFAGGDATILDGSGDTSRLEGAALANCVAGNALDIDDGNRRGDGHAASLVVPVALAVAEEEDASVGEFLEAALAGYEVAIRTGDARRRLVGYHNGTGSWAPVGGAAAAGKLRGFDRDTLANAIGMADFNAPLTPVMRSAANPGNGLTKDGIGWGALVAASSVSLAEKGLNGSGTLFDHEEITTHESLGETFSFDSQNFKPYPGCRWTHAGIDAVLDLYDEHDIDPDSIRSVDVYTFEQGAYLTTRIPENADEAEYSYPFPMAVALIRGDLRPSDLQRDTLTDAEILAMTERIDLHHDPDLVAEYGDAFSARVEIHTGDATYAKEVTHPRGEAERPLSDAEFEAKMHKLYAEHPDPDAYDDVVTLLETPDAPVADLVDVWR